MNYYLKCGLIGAIGGLFAFGMWVWGNVSEKEFN